MKWSIISDSSSDIPAGGLDFGEIHYDTVPFILRIEDDDFVDDKDVDLEAMLNKMEHARAASHSACPSPQAWEEHFLKSDNTIAITISANLSGCYNSAVIARDNVLAQHPEKRIHILNSRATGPETALCIRRLIDLINQNVDFDEVVELAEQYLADSHTAFALCSFDNLIKNGRMNKLVGIVAKTLGVWGVGIASDEGTIAMKGKARGTAKAIDIMLNYMSDCNYRGNRVAIHHCENDKVAQRLKAAIIELYPRADVVIRPTRALDSYYAERGGIIIGFKCN